MMKIKDIHIQNFRVIEALSIVDADPHMNLIVGINGAGKTSVLDALAMLLSWFIARMRSSNAKGLLPNNLDIRIGSKEPCFLSIDTENGVSWGLGKKKAYTVRKRQTAYKTDLSEMSVLADEIVENAEHGGNVPVLMYYPVERTIASVPVNLHKAETNIWDVYKDALAGNSNFRSFFEWYRRQEDIENEMIRDDASYRDHSLNAVRKAISAFFPDFSEMRVRRRPYQAMIIKKGEQVIEFSQLSQGEKCYLSLVCDIARRLAIANPGMNDPLEGEGIILIDEVDLHLHPKWQMEIVNKLTSIFKNCQFFISTHSPIVLSDIRKHQIITIDNGRKIDVAFEPYGKPVSSIMNNFFDMPYQRNMAVAKDIQKAFAAIRNGDAERFNELFGKLMQIIGPADSDMVRLMVEAKRKGLR
ncbi:AAA family ATPase [Prevotella sp.]|uniref:AAA family ATPase n=1 Tax=Prevotella sp. TaxID=59823 RepID=UPI0025CD6933|nr:AAA family ATPase [Prevotella sp.]